MNDEMKAEAAATPEGGGDDVEIVIRNAEQQAMIDALVQLRAACNTAIDVLEAEWQENESLYGEPVRWEEFTCIRAERFLDSDGGLGWRVYCEGVGCNATKLLRYLRDRLEAAGYDGVGVTPVC